MITEFEKLQRLQKRTGAQVHVDHGPGTQELTEGDARHIRRMMLEMSLRTRARKRGLVA